MYLFCFQPEIPFMSTFLLHSTLSAYQGLLLKAGELFFPALSEKKCQNCGFLFVELGGQIERFGKGLNFFPESLPCCLQFVQVNYDGMDRNHITFSDAFFPASKYLLQVFALLSLSQWPPLTALLPSQFFVLVLSVVLFSF